MILDTHYNVTITLLTDLLLPPGLLQYYVAEMTTGLGVAIAKIETNIAAPIQLAMHRYGLWAKFLVERSVDCLGLISVIHRGGERL